MIENIYDLMEKGGTMAPIPKDATVAMAYIPLQSNDKVYSTEQGFVSGTMFPVLNKPFKGCDDKR
ncbi:MAG: spore coat associated protein CotJA [Acutalibacteraceae bacterium]|nr:spore coat associated protein CotJA [Acutalibacteraceae bacterium]